MSVAEMKVQTYYYARHLYIEGGADFIRDNRWWATVLCGVEVLIGHEEMVHSRENVTCLRCLVILAREGAATL